MADMSNLLQSTRLKPGQYVEQHGKELSFDELSTRIGELVLCDCSTESHEWIKAVRVERIIYGETARRLIYSDGRKQHGYVGEYWFRSFGYQGASPAIFYELTDEQKAAQVNANETEEGQVMLWENS